jgi:16S rRNA (cytosine967-C5)-methyltransferase
MVNPRKVAFDILYKIECEDSYSSLTVNKVLKEVDISTRDSSFVSAIIYGVLERKITLDYIIRQYSSVRLKKIETKTLILLRMGVYQLLFMDKVPDSAAVNESVKLAKGLKLYKSSGFINGILRSITRAENKFDLSGIKDKNRYLSVKYSVPEDIVKMWLGFYGEEVTVNMMECFNGRPPLYARVNTRVTTAEKLITLLKEEAVTAEKTPLETMVKISNTGSIENLQGYKNGLFYIQDLSSNVAVTTLSPKENDIVYDVCSAPGGKSFSSALLMKNKGKIYSFDLYSHKIKLIDNTAKRLGIKIINSSVQDALHITEKDVADVVICDVPCSGLGLMRRKPEIRYKEDIINNNLPEIQYEILKSASGIVKSGGRLMYSTCTLNPEENNKLVKKFLENNSNFKGEKIILPKNINRTIDENSYECSLFPQTNDTDGFYFAILRKD